MRYRKAEIEINFDIALSMIRVERQTMAGIDRCIANHLSSCIYLATRGQVHIGINRPLGTPRNNHCSVRRFDFTSVG